MILNGLSVSAQPGARVDLPKPEKFANRQLASEKTGEGRIGPVKRFQQNIVTKYNFHFNAENELNEALAAVRQAHKDDYTQLLSFFDYAPREASGQSEELDSVILKCNNGILLHDLRNDWVDDLYLLMGKAYYLRNELDSALFAFQYINYAFQPRTRSEYGYEKTIGSRMDGTGDVQSISTRERKGVLPRLLLHTPVRNDAILWLLRTLIEQGRTNEAGGLVELLRVDPSLPARLQDGLSEMCAYGFYQLEQYDSAAIHLERALDLAATARERARREFLTAQLYERAARPTDAERLYEKVISHTTDPVMEAYARINQMNLLLSSDDSGRIERNIQELLRMGRKARYEEYLHIIYYAAARLESIRNGNDAAIGYLRRSIAANAVDPVLERRSLVELGALALRKRDFPLARNSYDSIQLEDLTGADSLLVASRRPVLTALVSWLDVLHTEDSLQRIADLPEAERQAYIKALAKKLRKAQGLQEEEDKPLPAASPGVPGLKDEEPVNLFARNESKGEWYFYNAGLRNQGFRQFQSTWGKRPNLDNWRRLYAVNAQLNAAARGLTPPDADADGQVATVASQTAEAPPMDVSEGGLTSRLPLTPALRERSDDTIQVALHHLGGIFREQLDDCDGSIEYLTQLLDRFPKTRFSDSALYHLTLCFQQRGDVAKAAFYRNHLARLHPSSPLVMMIDDPKKASELQGADVRTATLRYEEVYQRMIEGRFEDAFRLKQSADSSYGQKYWTAQLLYVEAVYHISQREDSIALLRLDDLRQRDGNPALALKAATMQDVLKRRKEIEAYLTALEIRRIPEDSIVLPPAPIIIRKPETIVPTITPVNPTAAPVAPAAPLAGKVDSAFFRRTDTVARATRVPGMYNYLPADSQVVVLVLDRVDPVYRNEARVGLSGYHRSQFPDMELTLRVDGFNDDVRLILIEGFDNLATAIGYIDQVSKASSTEIFPWLAADKYRYLPVSVADLPLFMEKKDERGYVEFLRKYIPGKF